MAEQQLSIPYNEIGTNEAQSYVNRLGFSEKHPFWQRIQKAFNNETYRHSPVNVAVAYFPFIADIVTPGFRRVRYDPPLNPSEMTILAMLHAEQAEKIYTDQERDTMYLFFPDIRENEAFIFQQGTFNKKNKSTPLFVIARQKKNKPIRTLTFMPIQKVLTHMQMPEGTFTPDKTLFFYPSHIYDKYVWDQCIKEFDFIPQQDEHLDLISQITKEYKDLKKNSGQFISDPHLPITFQKPNNHELFFAAMFRACTKEDTSRAGFLSHMETIPTSLLPKNHLIYFQIYDDYSIRLQISRNGEATTLRLKKSTIPADDGVCHYVPSSDTDHNHRAKLIKSITCVSK